MNTKFFNEQAEQLKTIHGEFDCEISGWLIDHKLGSLILPEELSFKICVNPFEKGSGLLIKGLDFEINVIVEHADENGEMCEYAVPFALSCDEKIRLIDIIANNEEAILKVSKEPLDEYLVDFKNTLDDILGKK